MKIIILINILSVIFGCIYFSLKIMRRRKTLAGYTLGTKLKRSNTEVISEYFNVYLVKPQEIEDFAIAKVLILTDDNQIIKAILCTTYTASSKLLFLNHYLKLEEIEKKESGRALFMALKRNRSYYASIHYLYFSVIAFFDFKVSLEQWRNFYESLPHLR